MNNKKACQVTLEQNTNSKSKSSSIKSFKNDLDWKSTEKLSPIKIKRFDEVYSSELQESKFNMMKLESKNSIENNLNKINFTEKNELNGIFELKSKS